MKKLLLIPLALLALSVAFTAFRPAPESDALKLAKEAAAISDLQRQGSDAAFRSAFIQWAAVIFLCLIVVAILAALVYLFGVKAHQQRMELARISKDYDIIYLDGNGNSPLIRQPDGEVQQFEPGNTGYAPQFVHGLQPTPLPARAKPGRDLTVRANQQPVAAYYSHFVEPLRKPLNFPLDLG